MKEAFENTSKAVKEGMDYVAEAFGKETDEDLQTYDSLDRNAFEEMNHKYGIAKVSDYIKHMEAKRMGVK